jgi:hypothetical protein
VKEELKVLKAQRVLRVQQDHKVHKVQQVSPGLLESQVQQDHKVRKEQLGLRVLLVHKDLKVQLV